MHLVIPGSAWEDVPWYFYYLPVQEAVSCLEPNAQRREGVL